MDIAKIDDQVITSDEFVKLLKLSGKFDSLMNEVMEFRLTSLAARKAGVSLSAEEVQARADKYRRAYRLHRAADTNAFLDAQKITLDEFENYIRDTLYQETVLAEVCGDAAMKNYFALHSPKFESIEISHMVLDCEGKAREIKAAVADDPESFARLAREHSVADTAAKGGYIGKVFRGMLPPELESKVFTAPVGSLVGPLASSDGARFEIFRIDTKKPAELDGDTTVQIRRLLREAWLAERAKECCINAL